MTKKQLLKIIEKAARDEVTTLDLSSKKITELPPEIGNLTNLTYLYLANNQLTSLPPEIGNLTNLTNLYLDYNQLTSLPSEFGNLTNIINLSLSDNQLNSLPPEIGNLTSFEFLYLNRNQLTTLPSELGNLTDLGALDLANNQLTSLPPEIGNLTNLFRLALDGNYLTSLPPEIGKLTNLTVLSIYEISLTDPPPDIVSQGIAAILTYLREKLVSQQQQWLSKLLLVGEGGVGKTSLLHCLKGEKFDDHEETTPGVVIRKLDLDHPKEKGVTMRLNCWDFAGQSISHATHQFFLTNRSLFLLVWNARHGWEQGKLHYWLDTIKAKAPESPVMIVATHIDQHHADLALEDLKRKYPQVKGHWAVSNRDGTGIEELKQAITEQAADLPLMGENWPSKWLNTAEAIRGNDRQWISSKEFWDILKDNEIEEKEAKVLAQWLHELGDILFFKDDEELKGLVILKPQWVTDHINRVLISKDVKEGDGILHRTHMEDLWSDLDPTMQEHFLKLMEKFDLSYRTLENRQISIVVERLSKDEPKIFQKDWDAAAAGEFCREISMKFYLNTIPAGIPTWFIARTHRFTTNTHWRYGALFAEGEEQKHYGSIRSHSFERYLQLNVRGALPYNFFALLRDGLELTLNRFPGLDIKRTVPCPCENGGKCVHEFDLTHVERAVKAGEKTLQCYNTFKEIPVHDLILGTQLRVPTDDSNLLMRILKELEEISQNQEKTYELLQILSWAQREFIKDYYDIQRYGETHCPNVFVLRPVESDGWLKKSFQQKVELQLYCQAPGCWHPTKEGGRYIIKEPAGWLSKMAPYIGKLVSVLKFAAPIAGPWMAVAWPEYEKLFHHDIELMKELANKLPESKKFFENGDIRGYDVSDHPARFEGADLRELRQLLDKEDDRQLWGGLRKTETPEGHFLWLCEEHAREYKR
ncbi:GTPase [candidate division LCP-89 bacterium B3_LCP]|uniref:non-specific serine/threonine protein kinase n=1 Tax=candidate division LCP-89 bacterium B3_LCP TaxID=2012998 RepID=A0A532UZ50_UNCL8|nr:MAG: GTPase [candidate division LCP-89 bacterium B3_LCP]